MRTSDLLIEYLSRNNIRTYFVVVGECCTPLVDSVARNPECKFYCFKTERAASFAAQGFFRSSNKVGVVICDSGSRAMEGVSNCWISSVPVVFLCGQVPTDEYQEGSSTASRTRRDDRAGNLSLVSALSSFHSRVSASSEITTKLEDGIEKILLGRHGPLILEIPFDVLMTTSSETLGKATVDYQPSIQETQISEVKNLLENSIRPLFLFGAGVRFSGAENDLPVFLSNYKNCAYVSSWGGYDLMGDTKLSEVGEDFPVYLGNVGVYGTRSANFAVQSCDLLVVVGSRMDKMLTGKNLSLFSPGSKKVMVDVDQNEIDKFSGKMNIDCQMCADARLFFEKMNGHSYDFSATSQDWKNKISFWKTQSYDRYDDENSQLNSYVFMKKLNEKMGSDTILVTGQGGNMVWTMQNISPKDGQRIISGMCDPGSGYSLPASIGAAIGSKEKTTSHPRTVCSSIYIPPVFPYGKVVCVEGDGGFQSSIEEIQTFENYGIPIKILVLNSRGCSLIKNFQDLHFSSKYHASDSANGKYSCPDFCKIAEAYGIDSMKIDSSSDVDAGLETFLYHSGSILCEVIVNSDQKQYPMLEEGNPLENMSPYLEEEVIRQNMMDDYSPPFRFPGWESS